MLKVNEIFGPTIQGEGPTAGSEVMFLRLALCNLHCCFCDTPYTWNWNSTGHSHPEKYNPSREIHEMDVCSVVDRIRDLAGDVRSLVISGGEPLIQNTKLVYLLETLYKEGGWYIEVETNCTIIPTNKFQVLVDQFNCSPKLSNSGNFPALSEVPHVIKHFASLDNTFFKFVVATEADAKEITSFVHRHKIETGKVYLMPMGKTKEELSQTVDFVRTLCKEYGFNFSARLHVDWFGGVRGA